MTISIMKIKNLIPVVVVALVICAFVKPAIGFYGLMKSWKEVNALRVKKYELQSAVYQQQLYILELNQKLKAEQAEYNRWEFKISPNGWVEPVEQAQSKNQSAPRFDTPYLH